MKLLMLKLLISKSNYKMMKKSINIISSKQEFITFDGYLKVNEFQKQQFEKDIINDFTNDEENTNETNTNEENENNNEETLDSPIDDLKKIKKDSKVSYKNIKAEEKFSKAPQARFTEASIIKKLDELGIGRPSTYANGVHVQDRNYIVKKTIPGKEVDSVILSISNDLDNKDKSKNESTEENIENPEFINTKIIKQKKGGEKDKWLPTDIGEIVNKFLLENFAEILDYKFTAHIENQLMKLLKEISPGIK